MTTSIVIVTETADHEFPTLDEAHAFLSSMRYEEDSAPEVDHTMPTGEHLLLTQYRRDQLGMEYDPNEFATLSVHTKHVPGRVTEPTIAMPPEQAPYQFELDF